MQSKKLSTSFPGFLTTVHFSELIVRKIVILIKIHRIFFTFGGNWVRMRKFDPDICRADDHEKPDQKSAA
jgi:hypothetical protein